MLSANSHRSPLFLVVAMEPLFDPADRSAAPAARSPTRIQTAWMRAAAARRALAWASVAAFGFAFVAARVSHPASSHPSGLSAPAQLVAEIQGSSLGGGSIAAPAGAPSVATSSS